MSTFSEHGESLIVVDPRESVDALVGLKCNSCYCGFDDADHTPFLSLCGHLFCSDCLEEDDSIKCVCARKIDSDDVVECSTLRDLFSNLVSEPALRCTGCERLHPLVNCCRLRLDRDLERVYCVWCGVRKLDEDDDVVVMPVEEEMSEERDFQKKLRREESLQNHLQVASLAEEGLDLMLTVVCCCLCERRINENRRKASRGSRDSLVQALSCGHFVCSEQCLSEKIDKENGNVCCIFCATEIEEEGISAEYLGDLLDTAREGQKCGDCGVYRSRRDVYHLHGETKCIWCLVKSRETKEDEILINLDDEVDLITFDVEAARFEEFVS